MPLSISRRRTRALAVALALGAAFITLGPFTGGPPLPTEGFKGLGIARPAVGSYVALAGAFLALASTAVVALDVLRER